MTEIKKIQKTKFNDTSRGEEIVKYKIQPLEVPCDTIYEVTVKNVDGTYTIYTNTLCPDATQEAAVRELIDQME